MALRRLTLAISLFTALLGGVAVSPAAAAPERAASTGEVRFVKRMTPEFDRFVTGNQPATRAWINSKFWRTEVFAPFFDDKTSWYGKGWLYSDLYAVYADSPAAVTNERWILKDAAGNKLFIPWGCGGGKCPQYAADITSAEFRRSWIDALKANLAKGYRGAWIDDVNLELRVGDGNGRDVAPFSPSLGRVMTAADWRRAMADFVEQIRREVPNHELLHNSIWYAGQGAGRHDNPEVRRQIAAADYINLERGVTDTGLTGGRGEWSLRNVHAYADTVHSLGKGLIIDAWEGSDAAREYSLANYFLISAGVDGVGDMSQTPENWWGGWDANLGDAQGARYDWQGLMRRDFAGGLALVNEPQAPARTVTLPKAMHTLDGRVVTSVTLGAGQGAVLLGEKPSAGLPDGATLAGGGKKPAAGSGSATDGKNGGTAAKCKGRLVRVTYPTLRWNERAGKLVKAKGSARVCVTTKAKKGTKSYKRAVKRATKLARRASIEKARAARSSAVQAQAAQAA